MLGKFFVIFVLIAISLETWSSGAGENSYQLGAGDVITIRVFGEDELTFEQLRLTDAGTFSYPFLGEVVASGKTTTELEKIIADGLRGDYLVDPKVSVRILEYREFYVNGEVKSPGGYQFKPGLTVRMAVALAGGFTEWASKNKIMVIREADPERQPERAVLDAPIMPGDIITIDQGRF